ncbi:MAG: hypothetical protein NT117_03835 [Gammaproteobacteria bacterium]|nr:hypothetical protein [Gammaproteobacteria bacterium]
MDRLSQIFLRSRPVASIFAAVFSIMFAVLTALALLVKAPEISYLFAISVATGAALIIAIGLVSALKFGVWCVNRHARQEPSSD